MFHYRWVGLICIVCALTGSGCASIVSPGPDQVFITSVPSGAAVTIDGLPVGNTPVSTVVRRGAQTVSFSMAGYQTVSSPIPMQFNGWVIGNVFFGGIPGILIAPAIPLSLLDLLMGNAWKVSGTIGASLPKVESGDSRNGNGPDSIAAWLGRMRKYAELAQAGPPERK